MAVNGYSSSADPTDDAGRGDGSTSMAAAAAAAAGGVARLRRLKDLMWVREAREDLTAAEFACSVESGAAVGTASGGVADRTSASPSGSAPSRRAAASAASSPATTKRRRAVDYEKLMSQLNQRIRDMGCERPAVATEGGDGGASAQANLSDV